MNLALKYRPKQFSDVVGQRATTAVLSAMIAKNKLSQVLLFTGPSGVGKTTMARIVASQLNSEGATAVHEGTHPGVIEIDAASNGSVDSIRALKKSLNFAFPYHRVIILDEAHAMSDEAKAALLNLLEFMVPDVTIILITTEAHRIPKTIRHRCDTYEFREASVDDIITRLKHIVEIENIVIDEELLSLIANRAEKSFRESLMILDQIWAAGISNVKEYNELQGEVDFGPTLISSTLGGSALALKQLEDILRYSSTEAVTDRTIETLRDLILIKGGLELNMSENALALRTKLASKLGSDQIMKAMKIMWDLQTRLTNADPVRGLEMSFSLIGDIMKPLTQETKLPASNNARMSFAEMQNKRLTSQ